MRQTLHIFVKDVRGLRWQILAVLAVTLAVGYYLYNARFLLGLALCYLYRVVDVRSEYSTSPFPAEGPPPGPAGPVKVWLTSLGPTSYFQACPSTVLHVMVQHPIAHIRQDLTINNIRLDGYTFRQLTD
jgi:hypothetical protein